MTRKLIALMAAVGASLLVTAAAFAHGNTVIYPQYCLAGHSTVTANESDSWLFSFETGRYGSGKVSTDEYTYGFPDEDSDDVTITQGACFVAPAIQENNAWVSSGTAPWGQDSAFDIKKAQALLDGTYTGVVANVATGANVYRTPFAVPNGDGSYSLVVNEGAVPAGYAATGQAVGGDFMSTKTVPFPINPGVLDPSALWPGGLTAGVYIVLKKS